jgi:4-amino-4-deoxy-L-arabinose transferase-like glycosyltransferase
MIPASYKDSPVIIWLSRLGCLVAVVGAAAAMLWLSWGKWPDVLVDFGRELYVPWMLAEGKVLYRDLMYFNGPLSPYLNALWFILFGPGLRTLVWVNLALLATMMLVMYLVLRQASSPSAAFVACLVFIFLFAFSKYVKPGNYNYVCPYSHEATHGMLFSWVALACLLGHARSQRTGWLVGAGFACGLVFLTKPEFFVAIAAASVTALGLWAWLEKPDFSRALRSIGVFVAALLMPPLVAFALLWTSLPWSEAGIGTLGGWWYVWDSRIYGLRFYRIVMGMDAPLVNLGKMFLMAGVYAAILLPALVLATFPSRKWTEIILAGLVFAAVVTLVTLSWRGYLLWSYLGRPLPLFMIVAGSAMAWAVTRHRRDKHIGALVLIVFSFVILGKMLLNARLYHYGFVLAMPAMLVLVLALLDWIPSAIKNSGGRQVIFYAVALAVLVVINAWYVKRSAKIYARDSIAVGVGADVFFSDQRGEDVRLVVDWLDRHTHPQDTVAVLPEGAMINYLSRRRNSTPIVNLMPPEMLMFGEDRILRELQAKPPTYVILVNKETTEYGFRFFGRDYGQSIQKWLMENYRTAQLIGALPLRDDRFGILIIKRKATPIE